MNKVWMNGKIVPWQDATVHASNHALHYGDAVFEGIRFYHTPKGPAFFRIDKHIERMLKTMDAIGLDTKYEKDDIVDACSEIVSSNDMKSGYIRIISYPDMGIGLRKTRADSKIAVISIPWDIETKPLALKTSPYIRPYKSTLVEGKISGNYINCVLARQSAGSGEALFLDYQGRIAESAGGNIFFAKDGKLFTPSLGTFFPGITRDSILQMYPNTIETEIYPDDLDKFDECFITATATEITPVAKIDSLKFSSIEIAAKIAADFEEIVTGKNTKFDWLSF